MAGNARQFQDLNVEFRDHVLWAEIDMDGPINTLTAALVADLNELATWAIEFPDVRCFVLSATGDSFCAGADLKQWNGDERDHASVTKLATTFHEALLRLHRTGVPLIAGVNGIAAGAGFSLTLSADVVLVREDARFEYAYPRIGLPGDGGVTYLLPRIVGHRRAMGIAMLDEPIPPHEAVDLGLATEVVDVEEFDARLESVAAQLATGPTLAFGEIKRLFIEGASRGFSGQLAAETEAMARGTETEDYARGYEAFFERTDPDFVGH